MARRNTFIMPAFKVEVKGYDIVTCTQLQVVVFAAPVEVKMDSDGSITLNALNTDEAMNMARELMRRY